MQRTISILSFNCFGTPQSTSWSIRFKKLIKEINRYKPDILLLQEVISKRQREFLVRHLDDYKYCSPKHSNQFKRKGGLFTLSKFPLNDYAFHKFNRQGPIIGILPVADRVLRKGFESFKVDVDGKTVHVINTHLYANYKNKVHEIRVMLYQLTQLYKFIAMIPQDDVLLVGGDFNVKSKSELYYGFLEATDLHDPLHETTEMTYISKNLNKTIHTSNIDSKIDYFFAKNININKISQEIIFKKPFRDRGKNHHISDHFGLFTQINL
jgi:endonuclease/exonuclease/phosphatase family metal-dependent hydrolase